MIRTDGAGWIRLRMYIISVLLQALLSSPRKIGIMPRTQQASGWIGALEGCHSTSVHPTHHRYGSRCYGIYLRHSSSTPMDGAPLSAEAPVHVMLFLCRLLESLVLAQTRLFTSTTV